jgi:two-component system, LytTR family, sensor kinase
VGVDVGEQLERRLAETRLQLLNMQLQPHFLFNTLNTIAELVHEDAEAADRMITALSDLLRQTLDLRGAQEIPFDMELRLLGTYLEIQKTRFGDRLQVHIASDDDVANAHVPVLLLQPLVENAIRHGLAIRRPAGCVRIEARREAGTLLIAVIDDGPGAAEEAVTGREGIGLGNTRARLNALYGTGHAFELANVPGGGARVSIRLPFRTSAEGVA